MRCYGVQRRILFGVAAWLLGAATATAGSLLAISLLGQGITGDPGQPLTQGAVTRALASEAAEASPVTSPSGRSASPASATPAATGAAESHAPDPATTAAPGPADGRLLTSAGGEVVASCQPAGAYLISWSPLQGYEVGAVTRGPAVTARVTFDPVTVSSSASRVTMVVSCSAGVPSATSWAWEARDE